MSLHLCFLAVCTFCKLCVWTPWARPLFAIDWWTAQISVALLQFTTAEALTMNSKHKWHMSNIFHQFSVLGFFNLTAEVGFTWSSRTLCFHGHFLFFFFLITSSAITPCKVKQELEYHCFLKRSLLDCLSCGHRYYWPTVLHLGSQTSTSFESYGYEHIRIICASFFFNALVKLHVASWCSKAIIIKMSTFFYR